MGSRQEIRIPPRKVDNEEDAGGRERAGPRVVSWHQKLSSRLSPSFAGSTMTATQAPVLPSSHRIH